MKILIIVFCLICYQAQACDGHMAPKKLNVMSEEMSIFWNFQNVESQLKTTELIEKLLKHYRNDSKLSLEYNLRIFSGFMMYQLDGQFQYFPKGNDFLWVRSFLDDLIHHPTTMTDIKERLSILQQMYL